MLFSAAITINWLQQVAGIAICIAISNWEAALDDAPERGGEAAKCVVLDSYGRRWKRLLAYGSPWRKPLCRGDDAVDCGGGGGLAVRC